MATADTLDDGRVVPAPLVLPFGKLFFGYAVVPYKPADKPSNNPDNAGARQNEVCEPVVDLLCIRKLIMLCSALDGGVRWSR